MTQKFSIIATLVASCFYFCSCTRPPSERPSRPELVAQLYEAIAACDGDRVDSVLGHSFNLNEPLAGKAPVLIESLFCSPKMQQLLLAAGADIDAADSEGKTAVHYVIQGYYRATHLIAEYSPSRFPGHQIGFRTEYPHARRMEDDLQVMFRRGRSPIEAGQERRKFEAFEKALKAIIGKADLKKRDSRGWDALAYAISFAGESEISQVLAQGGDWKTVYPGGMTTALLAAKAGRSANLSLALKAGVNAHDADESGKDLLAYALESADRSTVERVLGLGGFKLKEDSSKGTPASLLVAASEGRSGIVEVLIARGASGSIVDEHGENGIFYAVRGAAKRFAFYHRFFDGSEYTSEMLSYSRALKGEKASMLENALDGRDGTLMRVRSGIEEYAEIIALLSASASVTHVSKEGLTPLCVLAQSGRLPQLADVLLQKGAPIDWKDKNGDTALFHAIRANNLTLIEHLIARGASTTTKNKKGQTAIVVAMASYGQSFRSSLERKNPGSLRGLVGMLTPHVTLELVDRLIKTRKPLPSDGTHPDSSAE